MLLTRNGLHSEHFTLLRLHRSTRPSRLRGPIALLRHMPRAGGALVQASLIDSRSLLCFFIG